MAEDLLVPATRGRFARAPSPGLAQRVAQLESALERERGRGRGLEHGLAALSQRVTELRAENAHLRRRLEDV